MAGLKKFTDIKNVGMEYSNGRLTAITAMVNANDKEEIERAKKALVTFAASVLKVEIL